MSELLFDKSDIFIISPVMWNIASWFLNLLSLVTTITFVILIYIVYRYSPKKLKDYK